MGKSKRSNRERSEHFTMIIRGMLETEAWRSLPTRAQALYPWLRLEWKGANHNNNGRIRFSVRQAERCMGVSKETARRAFCDLQQKGFIVVKKPARLGVGGQASGPQFELTEIKMPGSEENGGSRLYKDWRPGHDFPIVKAATQNPSGKNGRKQKRNLKLIA